MLPPPPSQIKPMTPRPSSTIPSLITPVTTNTVAIMSAPPRARLPYQPIPLAIVPTSAPQPQTVMTINNENRSNVPDQSKKKKLRNKRNHWNRCVYQRDDEGKI
ncbi:hypothetical protein PV327_011477 [Microctonus hyperodae]|uniref:Uncharacterized protein n=1 Tax=Microctonus hyperodae TaxID=165561 RepID=A0AA39C2Z3_MICHY|nr:hypothetical protein PV327_011477 [Microctonus hyperodae]